MDEGECSCGKTGEWMACPFSLEIHGEENFDYICDDCYTDRYEDI